MRAGVSSRLPFRDWRRYGNLRVGRAAVAGILVQSDHRSGGSGRGGALVLHHFFQYLKSSVLLLTQSPLTSFYAIQNGGRTGLLLSGEMHMGFALFPEWV
jgi:hypothetical protein